MLKELVETIFGWGSDAVPPIQMENCRLKVAANGHVVDLTAIDDAHRERPRRIKSTVSLTEPASFVDYWKRYVRDGESALFGTFSDTEIAFGAIFDYHRTGSDGAANWGYHKCTLELKATPEWTEWLGKDGAKNAMSPTDFARFIEKHDTLFVTPSVDEMLAVAESIDVSQAVSFVANGKTKDGRVQFVATEKTTDGAGLESKVSVPQTFTIAIPAYEGCGKIEVKAWLRYRISGGNLQFWYELIRPHRVRRLVFDNQRAQIEKDTGIKVLMGTSK